MSLANRFSMMVWLLCFTKELVPITHMTHYYDLLTDFAEPKKFLKDSLISKQIAKVVFPTQITDEQ